MPDINGIPYVESTDLVSGWPTVSQSVAQEVSDQLASKLNIAGGKILQIVRATDSTNRSTTSTSFVDVTGMSVTITPQKTDSAVLIVATLFASTSVGVSSARGLFRITDSSNNPIAGAQATYIGDSAGIISMQTGLVLVGYATPATTSATTYKLQFAMSTTGTVRAENDSQAGQVYAIEVSA